MRSSTRTKQRPRHEVQAEQEKINLHNSSYEMNQRINSLEKSLKDLSLAQDSSVAKSVSSHKDLLVAFENLSQKVDSTLHILSHKIGDIETQVNRVSNGLSLLKTEWIKDCLYKDEWLSYCDAHSSDIEKMMHEIETYKDGFNRAILALNHKIRDEVAQAKKELTPEPPKVDPVQEKIDAALQVWKVDCDGLVKEIAILKKSVSYGEKKFENLYTLIDRLKGEKGALSHKQV